jgi:hypothetical protein
MAEGTEAGRHWPARHGGGYPAGWQVRYRGRPGRSAAGRPAEPERLGTVAGPSLRDEHTSTTWVPVRPLRAAPDTPSRLVRATDIVDASPPGEPVPVRPADDGEDRGRTVVVELPDRGPR